MNYARFCIILATICTGASTFTSCFAQAPTPAEEFFIRNGMVPISPGNQYKAVPGTLIMNPSTWLKPADAAALIQDLPVPEHVSETVLLDTKGRSIFAKLFGYEPSFLQANDSGIRFSEIELDGKYIDDTDRESKLLRDGSPTTAMWKQWEKGGRPYAIYMITAAFTTITLHAGGLHSSDLKVALGSTDGQGCKVLTKADLDSIPKGTPQNVGAPAKSPTSADTGAKPVDQSKVASPTASTGNTKPVVASDTPGSAKKLADAASKTLSSSVPEGGIRICSGSVGTVDMAAKRPVPVAMKVCQIRWSEGSQSYYCTPPDNNRLRY